MGTNTVKRGRLLLLLAALTVTTGALGKPPKETMCVKQKNGMYKCKASGKIEKEPCCDTPSNDPKPPTPKKRTLKVRSYLPRRRSEFVGRTKIYGSSFVISAKIAWNFSGSSNCGQWPEFSNQISRLPRGASSAWKYRSAIAADAVAV